MLINLSPTQVAKVMGKTPQFVRIGLQRKLLPFGTAFIVKEHGKRYDYHIPAPAFAEYMGLTLDDLAKAVSQC